MFVKKINTIGIILAAGRGSRMKELTTNQPKCFVKVNGKRLIDIQIEAFKKNNINKIIIITGYKSEFFDEFSDCYKIYNNSWYKSNMFFSLTKAKKYLMKYNCIVSYSDIFFAPSAIRALLDSNNSITITYDPNWFELWSKRFKNPLSDAETFKINKNNYITEIGGKTNDINKISGQYMGLIKFKPSGWKKLYALWNSISDNAHKNKISITELFSSFINSNKKIKGIEYTENWGEIDSAKDYKIYKT